MKDSKVRSISTAALGLGFALLLGLSSAVQAGRAPVPKLLSPLPGDEGGIALAINNKGETAGISNATEGYDDPTAVKWNRKGEPTALPSLPGESNSWAMDINIRGEVVGASIKNPVSLENSTAVRWDAAGQPHALPPLPGGTASYARGINKAGDVVGAANNAEGYWRAVVWDHNAAVPRELPGAFDAMAINNSGQIVGNLKRWDKNGNIVELKLPVQTGDCIREQEVTGINARGVSVGTARLDPEEYFCSAARWSSDGEIEFLELPYLETYPGEFEYFDSVGHGIEWTGEVVGETPTYSRGGLWDRSGDFIPLLPFEENHETFGYAINARGEIAGASGGRSPKSGLHTLLPVVWR